MHMSCLEHLSTPRSDEQSKQIDIAKTFRCWQPIPGWGIRKVLPSGLSRTDLCYLAPPHWTKDCVLASSVFIVYVPLQDSPSRYTNETWRVPPQPRVAPRYSPPPMPRVAQLLMHWQIAQMRSLVNRYHARTHARARARAHCALTWCCIIAVTHGSSSTINQGRSEPFAAAERGDRHGPQG
eukprot:1093940-Amphidinium_carterae.1